MSRGRKRPGRRSKVRDQSRKQIPAAAVERIQEAGASVFRWYEQGLLERSDSHGTWQKLGQVAHNGAVLLWAVLTVAVLATYSPVAAAVAALTLGVGLLRSACSTVTPVLSVVVLCIATVVSRFDTTVLTGLVVLLMAAAIWAVTSQRYKDLAMGAALLVTVVGGAFTGGTGLAVAVPVVGALAGIAIDWSLVGVVPWARRRRMTPELYTQNPPQPHFQSPWLTRKMALSEQVQRNAPPEVTRKKAGAWGERRTALILLGLRTGRGTRIAHDVVIPGATSANADHVVVARSGWFVLDTKQFGTRDDPGVVRLDREHGAVQHVSKSGAHDVTRSVQTLLWACGGIGHAAGTRSTALGGPRGVLVVHGAAVEPGIVLQSPAGVLVDVIPAQSLLARIDGAPSVLSRSDLVQARFRLGGLRAASHGGTPLVVSPMGSWVRSNGDWYEQAPIAIGGATTAPPDRRGESRATQQEPSHPQSAPPQPSLPEAAHADWRDTTGPQSAAQPGWTTPDPLRGPMLDVDGTLKEEWRRMQDAPPAAADDLPPEFRTVTRGTSLTHVKFDDATQNLYEQDVVALRDPCSGTSGPYVWVCTPEQWVSVEHGEAPVRPTSLKVENLMRKTS